MPDFRAFVQQNLHLPDVSGAHESGIIEEMALDLESRYERALREGLAPEEAWRAIQQQIDWPRIAAGLLSVLPRRPATQLHPPERYNPLRNLWSDVRHTARMLRKSPAFTAVAVTTVALCLGASLTIFAVVDSILLRPLPFPASDRLVTTINSYPRAGAPHGAASLPNYYDYREKIKAFRSTAIITLVSERAIIGEHGSPYRVPRDRVSPEFFQTLAVPLLLGRSFTAAEMDYARSGVAILTYAFWHSYFHGDANVLGRKFQMDGVPTTVIGVLPRNFRFLSRQPQIYTPAASAPAERALDQRHNNEFQLIARLAPGVNISTARAQVAALNAQQLHDDPYAAEVKSYGFFTIVSGLQQDQVETIRPILLLLQCGVLFLLLMGSLNLVNLLLIRAAGRAKELAIRQSLGARGGHVVMQVFTETALLSLLGALLGLPLAACGIRVLQIFGVDQLPLGSYVSFNGRIALVAFAAAIVLGTLFALPVAWFNLSGRFSSAMQSQSRASTTSRAAQRLRHAFSVAQIALAFVLLTGAALLGISMKHVLEISPGFQTEHVVTGQLSFPYQRYPNAAAQLALLNRVVHALQLSPGVISAGAGNLVPFAEGGNNGVIAVEGHGKADGGNHVHYRNGIVGDYWRTLQIPLIQGRFLNDADNQHEQRACLVDQAFAKRYWPGNSALGHRFSDGPLFKESEACTIVGVVGSVKQTKLDDLKSLGAVYYPYKYWQNSSVSIVVRTDLAMDTVARAVRNAVLQIDPELPVDGFKSMRDLVADSLVTRRSPAVLAGVFAGFALLLTAVGTYGALAYAVSQRRREIGVRMALGAAPRQVLSHFLGLSAKLLASGMACGLFGAWLAAQTMSSLLFGVAPLNFTAFGLSGGVIVGVVLLATLLPSRRASHISPTEALRNE